MKRIVMCVAAATVIIGTICTATVHAGEPGEIEVPADVIAISEELGERYCICPELIQAICWQESRFSPEVEAGGCIGIMQVYGKWHKDRMVRLGATDLYDMEQNMEVAVDYLAELFAKYGDAALVLAVYHGESDIYKMSGYTESILELSEKLEREHGK